MKKKKSILIVALLIGAACLISWGVTGHRTVGKIAENHLTVKAKGAVNELLGTVSLADVSTWADEVRSQPEYRHTGSWHFLNLPLGLSFPDFEKRVEGMTVENVYSALLNEEHILGGKTTTREQKTEALKFIVHFVGDLHQPMHISRAEDKGGNTIQLNYEGQGTNLHSLWDTKLLEHEGLTYEQLADKYDHASTAQIRQWQSDPLIKWIWESYEVSSRLYAEIDSMKGRSIDESYYQAHIPIIRQRIEQAGIRLAGVLNGLFANGLAPSAPSPATPASGTPAASATGSSSSPGASDPIRIDIHDAANHVNEKVRICAKIFGYKALEGMTLVNLGAAYPDQLLTLVLRDAARDGYTVVDGQNICVTGRIENYKGKPEIVVTDPKQIEAGADK
jgi:hypothetical protein